MDLYTIHCGRFLMRLCETLNQIWNVKLELHDFGDSRILNERIHNNTYGRSILTCFSHTERTNDSEKKTI